MEVLRVGLIGYGTAGSVFHAPLINATAGLELAVVVTGNPRRAAAAQALSPNADVVATADDLFERDDLDLVVVATPNKTHAILAGHALERGLSIVIDKPIAVSLGDAEALQKRAEECGSVASVFQNRRWDGDFLTVRELMTTGVLGEVRRFESSFERWRPALKGGWRESIEPDEGGGLLFDLGSHLIDQALQLFGPVASVYGEANAHRGAADDDVFVALIHTCGTVSHLWMNAVSPLFKPRFRVLGSKAGYTKYGMDSQEDALRNGRTPQDADWGEEAEDQWGTVGAGDATSRHPTEHGAYQQYYAVMAEAVRRKGPVPVTLSDAVESMRVIDAARRAIADNAVVMVNGTI